MGAPRSEWVELGQDFKHSVLGKERKLRKETMLENNEVDLKQKDPVYEPQLAIEPPTIFQVLSDQWSVQKNKTQVPWLGSVEGVL